MFVPLIAQVIFTIANVAYGPHATKNPIAIAPITVVIRISARESRDVVWPRRFAYHFHKFDRSKIINTSAT